jgi:hypothetical protein
MLFPERTRYFKSTRHTAVVTVLLVFGMIFWGLLSFTSDNLAVQSGGGEDLRCYQSIVERISSGEGYYQAAYSELASRGYPTGSIFNWRPPLLGWAFGHLPDLRMAKAAAILLSFSTIWLWVSISSKELTFKKIVAGSILLLGTPIYSLLPDIYLSHEFWAGTLITVSLLFYAKGWRCLALSAGILSLLIRELALPFVAVMLVLSVYERKYKEALFWAAGIIAFFIMMVIHSSYIKAVAVPGTSYSYMEWLTFGGWTFFLSTASMHPYLFLLPAWVSAILVPLTLLGLSGWKGPLGSRIGITVGMYMLIFFFFGQEFNRYWGILYANLMLTGFLYISAVASNLYRSMLNSCDTRIRR